MNDKSLTKITPDSRNRLVGLVNKTAELVVSGHSPTDALVKAAGTQQYSPEFILRAAEAYNGAAHLQHFKQAALDTRGDNFDLVDGHQVLRDLIANDQIEKTSNVESVDLFSDDRYYFNTIPSQEFSVKSASSVPDAEIDFKDLISGSRKLDDKEKLAEAVARQTTLDNLSSFKDTLSSVKESYSKLTVSEKIKIGSEVIHTRGPNAIPVVITLCGMPESDCQKLAACTKNAFRIVETDDIRRAFEAVDSFEACQASFEDLGDKQADHYINSLERSEAINSLLGVDTAPRVDTSKAADITPASADNLNDLIAGKQASIPQAVGHSLVYRGVNNALDDAMAVTRAASPTGNAEDFQLAGIRALLDPAFLQETKEIELATTMKRLLQDPVISSHPPHAIEEALYEVQSMAPNASIYEPLLRSMLRKRLESEGRLDDHEINQLLSTDQALATRDIPSDIFPQVKTIKSRSED